MTSGKSQGARLKALEARTVENPESAKAHLDLGSALAKAGRSARAEKALRRAIELDPGLFEARVNLGGVYFSRWDFPQSVEVLREAVALEPDAVEGHYNLGLAHLYLGNAQDVVDCFRRVIEIDPEHPGGHYYMATGLNALGKVEAANLLITRAAALGFQPQPELLKAIEKALNTKNSGEEVLTIDIGDVNPGEKG
jgi:tetratricopeptide (TPR) repeat protein